MDRLPGLVGSYALWSLGCLVVMLVLTRFAYWMPGVCQLALYLAALYLAVTAVSRGERIAGGVLAAVTLAIGLAAFTVGCPEWMAAPLPAD